MSTDPRFGNLDLRSISLFEGMDDVALANVAERLEIQWLASGTNLFDQGDPPDALYILLSGALSVFRESTDQEPPRWMGQVRAGETVGEMAMLSGKPRTASVRAMRDSEVLRFKRSDFEALVATDPSAMLHIARIAFQRLEARMGKEQQKPRQGSAIAVVPASAGSDCGEFARQLALALERFGSVALINEAESSQQSSAYFHALEQKHRFVLYWSARERGPWFELCRRQADELLYVLSPDDTATQPTDLPAFEPLKRERLIIRHSHGLQAGLASRWQARPKAVLHHVCGTDDVQRIARFITGNATGLVLGGGGARGFAHLGVIRALREHGLQVDAIGGTSIGGIIAAGVAMQWNDEEMYFRYYRSFVERNPLRDYTLPFIALVAGRQATARMKQEFGSTLIEDLAIPFYCVSTNLTRGTSLAHKHGPLWRALRASVAIPGVLPPVFHGGEVLVDGGVINNLPVDVMRRELPGRVIAIDIAGDYAIKAQVEEADLPPVWRMMRDWFAGVRPRPSILQILLRSGMVNSASTAEDNRKQSDLIIKPPVEQLELLDWQCFDRAIEIGYRHTQSLLERQAI